LNHIFVLKTWFCLKDGKISKGSLKLPTFFSIVFGKKYKIGLKPSFGALWIAPPLMAGN